MFEVENRRILIVDDATAIHDDFTKILTPVGRASDRLGELLSNLTADEHSVSSVKPAAPGPVRFDLAHAHQGEEAYRLVGEAERASKPYAVAFIDVRMPPGWDGIETIRRIWADFPHVEVVICTAYSDYSWEEILAELGVSDQLQFLRKPFDVVSVKQMALALTTKWNLSRKARNYLRDLEWEVAARTHELADKIGELEAALEEIKQLRGILPMCVYCHKIRDDENFWENVDNYLGRHTLAEISHGICPECFEKHVEPLIEEEERGRATSP